MSTTIRFWEGSVGILIEAQAKEDGASYFWKFKLTRAFKRGDDSEKFKYDSYFTVRNVEALGKVMAKALDFIANTDSTLYVQQEAAKKAA